MSACSSFFSQLDTSKCESLFLNMCCMIRKQQTCQNVSSLNIDDQVQHSCRQLILHCYSLILVDEYLSEVIQITQEDPTSSFYYIHT